MPRYSYLTLSDVDFEDLVRDLLQQEWNCSLEAFRTGRDSGIDLRYSRPDTGKIIVQCKHFARSGFNSLLRHLKTSEKPKVKALAPERYVLATSVALTPKNKDCIVGELSPFVRNVQDVIGANDLDGLLARYPEIERNNFKLWLTSTSVIERVMNNAVFSRSQFEVEAIRKRIPTFVQSRAYESAMRMLEKNRVLVISGVPGIGKTTLAEMLVFSYLERGFEPVVIQGDIAEAEAFLRKSASRVFYYDDFLGEIFLGDRGGFLGQNHDRALVRFIEMVRQSECSRFILTTREHILRSAVQISERLAKSAVIDDRCIMKLDEYTIGQRARILYNHLYFSKLPLEYKQAVLRDNFFLEIVKHENFIPRLVEWLSTDLRFRDVDASDYQQYIKDLLKSPTDIWKHAFHRQLSFSGQNLLLFLYTSGDRVPAGEFEPMFARFHEQRADKYRRAISPGDFRLALKELDGAFLRYDSGTISYLNPSIRQFIGDLILEEPDHLNDLLEAISLFRHFRAILQLFLSKNSIERISSSGDRITAALCRVWQIKIAATPADPWSFGIQGRMQQRDILDDEIVQLLVATTELVQTQEMCQLASQAFEFWLAELDRSACSIERVVALIKLLAKREFYLQNGGSDLSKKLISNVLCKLEDASGWEWKELWTIPMDAPFWSDSDGTKFEEEFESYCEWAAREDVSNCRTIEEMEELREVFEYLSRKTSSTRLLVAIGKLEDKILELKSEESDTSDSSVPWFRGKPGTSGDVTDEDIKEMFSTLCSPRE